MHTVLQDQSTKILNPDTRVDTLPSHTRESCAYISPYPLRTPDNSPLCVCEARSSHVARRCEV